MPNPPIVYVPGLGGSFNLPALLDWRGPSLDGWEFPPFIGYSQAFVETCLRAGYVRDRDLFVAFYDWRKPVADSARLYLHPWLRRARERSGSPTVAIVAHSMGGLVARSYIQSDDYAGDVSRLITIGTPHRGSARAYFTWEGGAIDWGVVASAVLNVYLWYLRFAHPFQTKLNQLLAIRTQAPGIRDLLPIDGYLRDPGPPPRDRDVDTMLNRNLWAEFLNAPPGMARLLERTPVSTISGDEQETLERIVVGPPPVPPGTPPHYADGAPIERISGTDGDGTVLLGSARLPESARVRNLPSVPVVHDKLPDAAAAQVLRELGVTVPAEAAALQPAPEITRLVVMTASPVTMTVRRPPAMAGARAEGAGRVRVRNYGHRGKRLNMAIIEQPAEGRYTVRLRGTATGPFAIGAFVIGPAGVLAAARPGAAPVPGEPSMSAIAGAGGAVAAGTELFYEVELRAGVTSVRLDRRATAENALARLRAAAAGAPEGVMAALRETASEALAGGETQAVAPLRRVTEEIVGPADPALAAALLAQFAQIAAG